MRCGCRRNRPRGCRPAPDPGSNSEIPPAPAGVGLWSVAQVLATVAGVTLGSTSQRVEPAEHAPERVGRLLSVNVGLPKDVPWQGRTVFTGVFKDSVPGPRRVRRLNLDGDGQ